MYTQSLSVMLPALAKNKGDRNNLCGCEGGGMCVGVCGYVCVHACVERNTEVSQEKESRDISTEPTIRIESTRKKLQTWQSPAVGMLIDSINDIIHKVLCKLLTTRLKTSTLV